jgi:cytochrome P450
MTSENATDQSAPLSCPLSAAETEWAGQHFDPTDSAMLSDPYRIFDWLREACPVAHSDAYETGGFWLLSRYEDVKSVAMDAANFSTGPSLSIPAVRHDLPLYPEEANGERHTFLRALVNAPLTRAAIAENRYEAKARAIAAELLARLRERGHGEVVSEISLELPARVMFQQPLLGTPSGWSSSWLAELRQFFHDHKYVPARSAEAARGLQHMVEIMLNDRRRSPQDDIPTRLLQEADSGALTMTEVTGMVFLLILGGVETPANAHGLMLLHMARHPELLDHLRAHPEDIGTTVDEVLRFYGPSQGIRRTVENEITVGGKQLKKGDAVWLMFNSADRDVAAFENGDVFDPARKSNRHLGFGIGIHRCIGAQLATLMMRVLLEELVGSGMRIRVADESDLRWAMGTSRSLRSLHVEVDD